MRKLGVVINELTDVSTDEVLNSRLISIQKDLTFTAPELMYMRWEEVHAALIESVPTPINEESVELLSIFSTKSKEEIRDIFNQQ